MLCPLSFCLILLLRTPALSELGRGAERPVGSSRRSERVALSRVPRDSARPLSIYVQRARVIFDRLGFRSSARVRKRSAGTYFQRAFAECQPFAPLGWRSRSDSNPRVRRAVAQQAGGCQMAKRRVFLQKEQYAGDHMCAGYVASLCKLYTAGQPMRSTRGRVEVHTEWKHSIEGGRHFQILVRRVG